jgi:hypothetical protein
MKSVLFAAASAALLLAGSAQAAEGFNILLGGSGWKVPHCKEGKVLREIRDQRTGRITWRCVVPPQQTAQVLPPRR